MKNDPRNRDAEVAQIEKAVTDFYQDKDQETTDVDWSTFEPLPDSFYSHFKG